MCWFIYWFFRLDKKQKSNNKSKNEDDKCFEYTETVALNYDETEWNPERISNVKLFINKYNWEGINYQSKLDDWKRFQKNNQTITLNILYTKK